MSESEKVLTYEDAKQMCKKAFDGGAAYGSGSMMYHANAVAYDWEHWLKKNESLFKPKPTVEDVLREMLDAWGELPAEATNEAIVAEYAAKLRLAEREDA